MKQHETKASRPQISFVLNDVEYTILESANEKELEVAVYDVTEWVEQNDGRGKSEEEKDELYKKAQGFWKTLSETLQNTKFNLYLNKSQSGFLSDLIKNRVEYDVNSVFLVLEISDIINEMSRTKFVTEDQLLPFTVSSTEITYIYHIISKHKIKGFGKDVYNFVEILTRIGQISKLINYYDIATKGFSANIQKWVAGFDDEVGTPELSTNDLDLEEHKNAQYEHRQSDGVHDELIG